VRADVGPPPDYKDGCVTAGVSLDAPGCVRCRTPEFKDKTCHVDAAAAGLHERCRGWSYALDCPGTGPTPDPAPAAAPDPEPATTPTKATTAATPPTETQPKSKGCVGGTPELAGAFAALVGWRATRRRR
jgi:hypothetical protein